MESLRVRLLIVFTLLVCLCMAVNYMLIDEQKFQIVSNFETNHLDVETRILEQYWLYLGGCEAYDPKAGLIENFDFGFSNQSFKAYSIICPGKPPYEIGVFPKSAYENKDSQIVVDVDNKEKWILYNYNASFGTIYALSYSPRNWGFNLISSRGLFITLIIVLLSLAALYKLIDLILKPLEHLNLITPNEAYKLSKLRLPIELEPVKSALLSAFENQRIMQNENWQILSNERQFAANAAHELLTPLSAIKTEIQMQKRLEENRKASKIWLLGLESRLNRAIRTVDQLVILARLNPVTQKGKYHLKSDLNVNILLDDLLLSFSDKVEDKCLQIHLQTEGKAIISAAPIMIDIMFRNLLENAIKYSPNAGDIHIELKVSEIGSHVKIRNHCAPLPEYLLDNLFDRFIRGPNIDVTGSGLGLSIAQMVAEAHDTSIEVNVNDRRTEIEFSISFNQNRRHQI